MGPPKGKILVIDTVSYNRLNSIKIIKFGINLKKERETRESILVFVIFWSYLKTP